MTLLRFFSAVNSKLVTVVESGIDGFFQIELDPGDYSLFIEEDGRFYSSRSDSNAIFPVTIELDKVTEVRFDITHKATF